MLHLYYGDGKGKTTAAMGLALRALGHGQNVVIVQFLKDGTSGEIEPLRGLGATIYACPNAKFSWLMNEADRICAKKASEKALQKALAQPFDVLILDEACAALNNNLVEEKTLQDAVERGKRDCEVVLTGRKPMDWMIEQADYITEMRACKHPYTQGVAAREGIEF